MIKLDVPIIVPPAWTAKKDLAYFTDCFGHVDGSWWDVLQTFIKEDCMGLASDIDAALSYFHARDVQLVYFPLDCMTLAERIDLLETVIRSSKYCPPDPEELYASLASCLTAETERSRVFQEYQRSGRQSWLYPVVTVIHYCGAAAFHFENAMQLAYPNFIPPDIPGDHDPAG